MRIREYTCTCSNDEKYGVAVDLDEVEAVTEGPKYTSIHTRSGSFYKVSEPYVRVMKDWRT